MKGEAFLCPLQELLSTPDDCTLRELVFHLFDELQNSSEEFLSPLQPLRVPCFRRVYRPRPKRYSLTPLFWPHSCSSHAAVRTPHARFLSTAMRDDICHSAAATRDRNRGNDCCTPRLALERPPGLPLSLCPPAPVLRTRTVLLYEPLRIRLSLCAEVPSHNPSALNDPVCAGP